MRLEAVFEAARAGDVEVVRAALSADPAIVDARGEQEARLLHVAAERDDVALAQLLLDYDAEREVEADWGHTPFEWAATLGSERVAGLLLDAGALRLNLWTAAALGTLGIVEESFDGEAVIVGHGRVPAPGADLTGWSLDGPFLTGDALSDAFYIACRNGHFSVAAYLLERGADVNACGYFGAPALHWAATNRHRDVVEWLLACGDDRSILDPHFDASPSNAGAQSPLGTLSVVGAELKSHRCLRRTLATHPPAHPISAPARIRSAASPIRGTTTAIGGSAAAIWGAPGAARPAHARISRSVGSPNG
jgi:hypothetical protein